MTDADIEKLSKKVSGWLSEIYSDAVDAIKAASLDMSNGNTTMAALLAATMCDLLGIYFSVTAMRIVKECGWPLDKFEEAHKVVESRARRDLEV